MSPLERKSVLDKQSVSGPGALRRLSAQQRRAESDPAPWSILAPCPRQSLPACVVPAPGGRRPSAGLAWLAGRFGKRAQSDPWISDRIRRYFLTRTFDVGPAANALLLSLVWALYCRLLKHARDS